MNLLLNAFSHLISFRIRVGRNKHFLSTEELENDAEIKIEYLFKIQGDTFSFLIITPGIHAKTHFLLLYGVIRAHGIASQVSNIHANVHPPQELFHGNDGTILPFPDYQ